MEYRVAGYLKEFRDREPEDILRFFLNEYGGRIALASSLGAEDQVLTDMSVKIKPEVKVFTLDTGRLPQETYDIICETMEKYRIKFKVYFPDALEVEKIENEDCPNLFYENVENRRACCRVRKVKPLKRALKNLDVWITGLRRRQTVTRANTEIIEWDRDNDKIKINPLAGWTDDKVWEYIRENDVPYNKLHDKGYPSIGCAPCTRAVKKGEDARAGRWWWERAEDKECGLHYKYGRLVRKK